MLSREANEKAASNQRIFRAGSGFRIAYNDLEIRGGEICWQFPSPGIFPRVGYELYTELMEKKRFGKSREKQLPKKNYCPKFSWEFPLLFPKSMCQDVHQRLVLYKRISLSANDEDINQIKSDYRIVTGLCPICKKICCKWSVLEISLNRWRVKRWAMTVNICIFFPVYFSCWSRKDYCALSQEN